MCPLTWLNWYGDTLLCRRHNNVCSPIVLDLVLLKPYHLSQIKILYFLPTRSFHIIKHVSFDERHFRLLFRMNPRRLYKNCMNNILVNPPRLDPLDITRIRPLWQNGNNEWMKESRNGIVLNCTGWLTEIKKKKRIKSALPDNGSHWPNLFHPFFYLPPGSNALRHERKNYNKRISHLCGVSTTVNWMCPNRNQYGVVIRKAISKIWEKCWRSINRRQSGIVWFSWFPRGPHRERCLSRSHLNGYGKTRSHHFLMDYQRIRSFSLSPPPFTSAHNVITYFRFFYYVPNLLCAFCVDLK